MTAHLPTHLPTLGSEPKRQINTGPPNSARARALPQRPEPPPPIPKGKLHLRPPTLAAWSRCRPCATSRRRRRRRRGRGTRASPHPLRRPTASCRRRPRPRTSSRCRPRATSRRLHGPRASSRLLRRPRASSLRRPRASSRLLRRPRASSLRRPRATSLRRPHGPRASRRRRRRPRASSRHRPRATSRRPHGPRAPSRRLRRFRASSIRRLCLVSSASLPPILAGAETEGVPEGEPVPPPMTYVRPPWWRFVCALSSETTDNRSIHVIALLLFCVLKNTSFPSFLKEKATRLKVPPRFTAGLLLGVAAFTFLFDAAVMGKDLNEVCTYLKTFADELKEESLKAKIQDDQVDITNIEE